MSYNASRGYYGDSYDRHVPMYNDQSTIYKMKETYWTTKQAVMKKLGKKEDEHVVASDSELDAKLEVFKAIQKSSIELLRIIERYQDRICVLSREENAMGRLLKSESQHDKTRAGKMMAAVGKAQCFSSQQMLQLRAPLVRLYQEVETFRYRAITDTLITVKRMEAARTEYRGKLLWMKDVSNELDPDTTKQLQKFRTVQAQVKKTKAKFDKLKLDVMQKIDLLAASRCNMFSHVLAKYQSTLLHFWERTAFRMTAVADGFKGYQYYEFSMLKELGEPSKKLAEETGGIENLDKDLDDSQDEFSDGVDDTRCPKKLRKEKDEETEGNPPSPATPTGFLGEHETTATTSRELVNVASEAADPEDATSDNDLFSLVPISLTTSNFYPNDEPTSERKRISVPADKPDEPKRPPHFIDLLSNSPCPRAQSLTSDEQVKAFMSHPAGGQDKNDSMTNLFLDGNKQKPDLDAFIDFGDEEEVDLEEIKRKQDEEFDFSGMLKQSSAANKRDKQAANDKSLLSDDLETLDLSDKDDMTILNEILNAPSAGDEFSQEWNAVFGGNTPLSPASGATTQMQPQDKFSAFSSAPAISSGITSQFMPSSLLEMGSGSYGAGFQVSQTTRPSLLDLASSATSSAQQVGSAGLGAVPLTPQNAAPLVDQKQGPVPKKKQPKQELSSWFNLFAELDPLANPDAIGRKNDDVTDA